MSDNKSAIGRQFEKLFAKIHGMKEQPGSGNGKFFKLDIKGKGFLYSLKATKKKSFSITKSDLDEAIEAANKEGKTGALVTSLVEGEIPQSSDPTFITLKFDDFKALVESDSKIFSASFEQEKIVNAEIPSLFKDKKKAQDE
jgi:hypothetical protein